MPRQTILDEFRREGYVVLRSVVPAHQWMPARGALYGLAERRTGWRSTKKIHIEDVLGIDRDVDQIIGNIHIARLVGAVLPGPKLWGARFRAPIRGHGEQTLHTDDDDGYHGAPRLITVIYPVDAFRPETGATRVVPRSHAESPAAVPSDPTIAVAGEVVIRADPGDALLMFGTTWHSGTRNLSSSPRGAISVSFVEPNLWV